MKRFFLTLFTYLLASIITSEVFTYYNISRVTGHEVRTAVRNSKTKFKKKIKVLIIGDSTGHPLYPCEKKYDSAVSLTCTNAVTMAGHFFMLKNYLEHNVNNLPQKIVLIYTPTSFSNDLNEYAYHHFLKPFPIWEYRNDYTPHLCERVKSIPYWWTAYLPFVHASGYTPVNSIPQRTIKQNFPQISYEYLLRIDSLAQAYNIPFYMYSSPVRDDKRDMIIQVCKDIERVDSARLSHLIKPYIQSVKYYPAEQFRDAAHMSNDYVPEDYLDILK